MLSNYKLWQLNLYLIDRTLNSLMSQTSPLLRLDCRSDLIIELMFLSQQMNSGAIYIVLACKLEL